MIKISLLFFLCCGIISQAQQKSSVVPIIFDSDMGPDYDDVGAITILHYFADKGEAKILATIASTNYEGVAGVLNVFNTYFNRPEIPIGVPKGKALGLKDKQHWSDSVLLNFPHKIRSNADAADAIDVYRKILSSQPDHSVTIVSVGFFTNLSNLLQSQPDQYSTLNGEKLVQLKVRKLVSMAGKFPAGGEFNVNQDPPASQFVFSHWPTPILLSGFEIGEKIKAGLPLINDPHIANSPVKDVFRISIPLDPQDTKGRMSWDETAVLIAVKGYKPWYNVVEGKMIVAADGSDTWSNESSNHRHIKELQPSSVVEALINKLIMHQPVVSRKKM